MLHEKLLKGCVHMFTWKDMGTFVWAFFLTLPTVALIHAAGHLFFAKLFGAHVGMTLGQGKTLVKIGFLKIKSFYFVEARCTYNNLKRDQRMSHVLIHAGGCLFNMLSIALVNGAIYKGWLPKHLFFYQFVYFSVYYIFFALLPIRYGKGHYSDGLAIIHILRKNKPAKLID